MKAILVISLVAWWEKWIEFFYDITWGLYRFFFGFAATWFIAKYILGAPRPVWWASRREKQLQKAILDLLATHRIRAGKPKTSDPYLRAHMLIAGPVIDSIYTALWIDCRRSRVGHPKFQQHVEAQGQRYLLAHSPDDVLAWLKEHAVIR